MLLYFVLKFNEDNNNICISNLIFNDCFDLTNISLLFTNDNYFHYLRIVKNSFSHTIAHTHIIKRSIIFKILFFLNNPKSFYNNKTLLLFSQ